MAEAICANCKHWDREAHKWLQKSQMSYCDNPSLRAKGYGSEGDCSIITSPDFGCNQFEYPDGVLGGEAAA